MCKCVNVEPGSYSNQVVLVPPLPLRMNAPGGRVRRTVCIDACLVDEIQELWSRGVRTTGCCCGHNIGPAFIGVVDDDIELMEALGYEVAPNPCRPGDRDSFRPRTPLH